MKEVCLVLLGLACASFSYAQKTELAVQLNSGRMKFGGASASKTTFMSHAADLGPHTYTNNPYGSKFGFAYGLAGQLQRVTAGNLLLGLQAGVETLQSRVEVERVFSFRTYSSSLADSYETTGHTNLRSSFANMHPYLGYRVKAAAADIDITFGGDAGIGLGSREIGKATASSGEAFTTDSERTKPAFDFRPRVGVTAYHNQFGLSASYAHGLTNYQSGYDGGNPKTYARVVRLGVLYRL